MQISKLTHMSIGPLWLERKSIAPSSAIEADNQAVFLTPNVSTNSVNNRICAACGKPLLINKIVETRQQINLQKSALLLIDKPIQNEQQQKLLDNCLQAAGWINQSLQLVLHVDCGESALTNITLINNAIQQIQPNVIVLLGQDSSAFITAQNQIDVANMPIIATHNLAQMLATPASKAQVWAELCQAHRYINQENSMTALS